MGKRSKHPKFDDPTAFGKKFPRIRKLEDGEGKVTPMIFFGTQERFRMERLSITIDYPSEEKPGFLMTIHGKNRYPTWDEVVWIRYNLLPDSCRIAMILPNLNNYINQEDSRYKYVFTFEQVGWLLDPPPYCPSCQGPDPMENIDIKIEFMTFLCHECEQEYTIDPKTWNEEHGNGFRGNQI